MRLPTSYKDSLPGLVSVFTCSVITKTSLDNQDGGLILWITILGCFLLIAQTLTSPTLHG
jgi:hypothetical protein